MSTPFPVGGRAIVERLAAQFPEWFVNDDEKQRQLTIKIGEQFAFTYGPQWGNKKRANLGDEFRSKDSIAVRESDHTISVFDLFSAGMAILVNDGDAPAPTHAHLPASEAAFMPCQPVNHLGGNPLPGEVPEPPKPSEPLPSVDIGPVLAKLDALQLQVDGLAAVISALVRKPDMQFPVYEGTVAIKYLGTGRAYLEPK
jgi:hypothetical protein